MHWQNKSEDLTHEEYHPESDASAFDIRQINLRKYLPTDWSTTKFILFLSAESSDAMGYQQPSKEEWEDNQPPPSPLDSPRRQDTSRSRGTLETIPEGEESEEEDEQEEPVNQLSDEDFFFGSRTPNPGRSRL